jgi:hypothetical protein
MKINSKTIMALIALGIAVHASAQNVIYVTGSTAFRSICFTAFSTPGDVFDTNTTVSYASFGSTTSSKGSYMLFSGLINGTATYIDCAWSGSEAGIASVANVTIQNTDNMGNTIPLAGSPETFLKVDGSITLNNGTNASPTGSQLQSSSRQADVAMADTSQAVSLTPFVTSTSTALKNYGTVGIVPFTWAKNYNSSPSTEWSSLTNVTLPQLNDELSIGYQKTALFTGIASQTNQYVYLVGRNKGSGTRANTLASTGYGVTKAVNQFSIGEGIEIPATGTLVLDSEANNGYESGGSVATALNINGSCQQTDPFFGNSGWYAIGYLGTSDASTLTLGTGQWLTLDGVLESDGAVEEGQYSFWGNEHVFGRSNISGYQDTDASLIFNGIQAALGTSGSVPTAHSTGINLIYMHASKSSDVAFPAHN